MTAFEISKLPKHFTWNGPYCTATCNVRIDSGVRVQIVDPYIRCYYTYTHNYESRLNWIFMEILKSGRNQARRRVRRRWKIQKMMRYSTEGWSNCSTYFIYIYIYSAISNYRFFFQNIYYQFSSINSNNYWHGRLSLSLFLFLSFSLFFIIFLSVLLPTNAWLETIPVLRALTDDQSHRAYKWITVKYKWTWCNYYFIE